MSDSGARDPKAGERRVKLACEDLWKVFGPGAETFLAARNGKADDAQLAEAGLIGAVREADLEGKKLEKVVAQWLKDNEATWKKWTQ